MGRRGRGGCKDHVYLVAGSIPESADGHIYSTAYTFDREGRQIGKYRKMHMFVIDVEGGTVLQ